MCRDRDHKPDRDQDHGRHAEKRPAFVGRQREPHAADNGNDTINPKHQTAGLGVAPEIDQFVALVIFFDPILARRLRRKGPQKIPTAP